MLVTTLLLGGLKATAAAKWSLFDDGWKFHRGDSPGGGVPADCTFPMNLGSKQCMGLRAVHAAETTNACAAACCAAGAGCNTWQFCPQGAKCAHVAPGGKPFDAQGCWIGTGGSSCPKGETPAPQPPQGRRLVRPTSARRASTTRPGQQLRRRTTGRSKICPAVLPTPVRGRGWLCCCAAIGGA
jgi:hypothetical protein